MFPALASSMAFRILAFPSGSPPPVRADTVISLINFVNSLPRLASSAPFLCLILCHLECPDIGFQILLEFVGRTENISQERISHAKPQRRKEPQSKSPTLLCVFAALREKSYFSASYSFRAS